MNNFKPQTILRNLLFRESTLKKTFSPPQKLAIFCDAYF